MKMPDNCEPEDCVHCELGINGNKRCKLWPRLLLQILPRVNRQTEQEMTQAQLTILESMLESREYKKWTTSKIGNESYDWFKTIVLASDKFNDSADGCQMAFRVWDWTKYPDAFRPQGDDYGIEFWTSPLSTDGRTEMNTSWHPTANVELFEKMAKGFYEITKKYKQ